MNNSRIVLILNLCAAYCFADKVTVYNHIDEDIYIATYYKDGEAQRIQGPIKLPANKSVQIERGPRVWYYTSPFSYYLDRQLFFDTTPSTLKEEICNKELYRLFYKNISSKQGKCFHIYRDNECLRACNAIGWYLKGKLWNPFDSLCNTIKNKLTLSLKTRIKNDSPIIKRNSRKDDIAHVRYGNSLCDSERLYLQKRKHKVRQALEKYIDRPIKDSAVPCIALLESGGGFRAMTSSLGFHIGLEKIGLLDAATYMVGVSGSTWSIALWLQHQMTLNDFKKHLTHAIEKGLASISKHELSLIIDALSLKFALDQELTLVDSFGSYLANLLLAKFENERHALKLTDQANIIENGSYPCPIYTAVRTDHNLHQDWYEFTPWEVGAPWLGCYVPTWAYGRKFMNGISVDNAPEQSLGYFIGTWGSAFAASLERMYREVESQMPKGNFVNKCIDSIMNSIGHQHLTASHINNFAQGIGKHPFRNFHTLKLGDAGMECNLPFVAVSGERKDRKADILIFMDAENDFAKKELAKVEKFARQNNFKFPVISHDELDKSIVSIFKDENDPSVPLVIYLPLVLDDSLVEQAKSDPAYAHIIPLLENFDLKETVKTGYARTSNFCYQEHETNQLTGLMEFNVLMASPQIKKAIEWKISQLEKAGLPTQLANI